MKLEHAEKVRDLVNKRNKILHEFRKAIDCKDSFFIPVSYWVLNDEIIRVEDERGQFLDLVFEAKLSVHRSNNPQHKTPAIELINAQKTGEDWISNIIKTLKDVNDEIEAL